MNRDHGSQTSEVPIERIDYHDHFELTTEEEDRFSNIESFVYQLATQQPGWLTQLSLGLRGRDRLEQAAGDGTFPVGSAIGNWRIVERTPTEVVMAEDMGMMRYRLTYTWLAPNRIAACTDVMLTSRWVGPIYWRLATPMHRRFLPMMMRNAAFGDGTVAALAYTGQGGTGRPISAG